MRNRENITTAYKVSKVYAVYMLVVFFLAMVFDFADRLILGAILPAIQADWGINDAQAGWLSTILLIFMIVFALPIGVLVDRWSRSKSVSLMVFIWSLACLGCAFTMRFWQMLSLRAVLGLGQAGYAPGASTMISGVFSNEKRAIAMSILQLGIPVGSAVGLMLGGMIANKYGWRSAIGLMAIPGFIIAILIWFFKDYRSLDIGESSTKPEKDKDVKTRLLIVLRDHILKTPSLIFNCLGAAMAALSSMGIIYWLPSYLNRFHGMDLKAAGIRAAIIAGIGIIGTPVGGILADWLYRKRPSFRQSFCGISQIIAALGIFLGIAFQNSGWYFAFFLLSGFGFSMYQGPSASVVQSVVHPAIRGTAFGLYILSMYLFGGAWSTAIVGYVSDTTGRLDIAIFLLGIASVISALFYFIGSKYYKKDEEKIKDIQLVME